MPQSSWPHGAVVYQIYPRSFYDSNNDGVGDLPGIEHKLDYLQTLSVTALWLSPFYTSPMADFGYDVADYRNVDPIFGTLDDARSLLSAAHDHDLRVMVDLVPNHSSDKHVWFEASKKSRNGKFADYYIWRDAAGMDESGNPIPPNNWINVFAGVPAWTWVEERKQFYMHSFHPHQPDLNWDNPTVREEIQDVMRFWLDLGVDGFRVDAVNFISKDPSFADDPVNESWDLPYTGYGQLIHTYSQSGPHLHEYLTDMANVLLEAPYADRKPFMVTEGYPTTPDHIAEYVAYYRGVNAEASAPFCFEGFSLPWQAGHWTGFLRDYTAALARVPNAIPAYAFSNHDNSRLVSRYGVDIARSAAVLLLTLPGMVFVYNGDELGMRDGVIPPELVVDPGAAGGSAGRDPERTPFQWSAAKNAGFSQADTTWLPVNNDYETLNVAVESEDPHSFLNLYQRLCQLRKDIPALNHGTMEIFETGNEALLGYRLIDGSEVITVLINFTNAAVPYFPYKRVREILVSTHPNADARAEYTLRPHEAIIFE